MIRKKFFWFILIFVFLLSAANFTLAERGLEVNYPEIGGIKPTVTTISLPQYIKYIFNISIILSGLIAFGVLVYAGFRYLTSAGNMAAIQDAKERISGAALGLSVLLGSYLILTTINPQLTFFDLPELKGVNIPLASSPSSEDGILHYTEIPVGGLAGDMFSKIRMARIEKVLEEAEASAKETKRLSEELEKLVSSTANLAEEIQKLVSQCGCQNTKPFTLSCGYFQDCPVTPPSPKPAGGYCSGEPCSNNKGAILAKNREIEQKKIEIFKKEKEVCQSIYSSSAVKIGEVDEACLKLYSPDNLGEIEIILKDEKDKQKGLVYQQKKLEIEMQGTAPEEKEKIIGLKKVYQDILNAEEQTKSCSTQVSAKGKINEIMTYSDFWQYREFLEKEKIIKKTEALRPYGDYVNIDSSNPYPSATFYCAEQIFSIPGASLGKIPGEEELNKILQETGQLKEKQPTLKNKSSSCGPEIPIGKAIDDVQELGKKLIDLIDNFQQKTQNIFGAAVGIINGATGIKEIKNLDEKPTSEKPQIKSLINEIKSYNCAVSAGCNKWEESYDCGSEEEPATCYNYYCEIPDKSCSGTPGTKDTADPKSEISNITSQIINLSSAIDSIFTSLKDNYDSSILRGIVQIRQEVVDLIEEKKAEDKLKISEIKKNLSSANNQLGVCYNSSETRYNLTQRKKVLWRELYSCATAKMFQLKTECYSGQGKADNYFCCQSEVGF
ncbi:MAG: hypothetical protein AAB451_02465 [Patescibacteria group bacterium]